MTTPLAPCHCGHSIEEHQPECTECDCVHYEANEEDDDE